MAKTGAKRASGRRWSGLAAAVAALAVAGCRHDAGSTSERTAAAAGPPVAVRAAAVARTEGGELLAPGLVEARERAVLSSRIAAAVVALPFREGDRVAAGAVVARLDAAALEAAVAAAEASARVAETDRRRIEALLAKGAATSREAEEATARAAGARAGLLAARDNLSYALLEAPFAGHVAARPVHVGDVVVPGAPVMELEGDGGFEVRATVEEALAAQARPGLAVPALVDGQPERLAATVRSVSPAGDPATHRFEVRADLPAAEGLRSGLFARLAFAAPSAEARFTVPEGAVFRRGGLTGVFVLAEGRAWLRWVAVGATAEGATEVRAGLEAGERVALDPAPLLDGVRVAEAR